MSDNFFKIMIKRREIIIWILFSFFISISLFFVLSREGKNISIKGSPEDLLKQIGKTEEQGKSPFSGISCENYRERAFGVVLHQSPETMPLSSISEADIIIEAPAANASGITRLLAIFQCGTSEEIGSVRSVRPYMVDLALGFDIILSSWGGSDSAISRVKELSLDFFDARINPSGVFFRKTSIPAPHNGFTSFSGLKRAEKDLKMRENNQFEGYKFLDNNKIVYQKNEQVINIDYYYPVKYVYDAEEGSYLRFWNGGEMLDRNTGGKVFAKNVVLMKTEIGVLSDGVADVEVLGAGEAIIYRAGEEVKGKWEKESPKSKLVFLDDKGGEIKFVPGSIWIEIIRFSPE